MANGHDRSGVIIFNSKARTGDFKRSNHNDFATSSELRDRKFTGWRSNSISLQMELWVVGEIRATVNAAQYKLNPKILEKVWSEVFAQDL